MLNAAIASGVVVAMTASPATAAVYTTADAVVLAQAMATPGMQITGAGFETIPPTGTPHGIGDSPVAGFPNDGPTFAILTTGSAAGADQPGGDADVDIGGGNVRGDTDFDVTVLRIDFFVPDVLNCLHVDFRFLSIEYPEWVGSRYNDAFIAELDASTWTTSGSSISAPDNFAFDPAGDPVTINTSGVTSLEPSFAAGTPYDGATPTLVAGTLVPPGNHSLYLSIFDQGDHVLDSAVFMDNLALTYAAAPEDCPSGSVVRSFNLDLSPAEAVNATGDDHTVTTTLTDAETGDPLPNADIELTVTGANAVTDTVTTNGAGEATFTYSGTNDGQDVITACFDDDEDGCDGQDARTSVLKFWETAPPTLALSPATATNDVGSTHIVTATLTDNGGAPINDASIVYAVTGANDVAGSATTSMAGEATFSYSGTGDGADTITACYDANGSGTCDIDEVTATAEKTWNVPDAQLSLDPPTATNPVGTTHTAVATLTGLAGLVRVANGRVLFTVAGANPTTGSALTEPGGEARFTYLGTQVGDDAITACFDANANEVCDPGEPVADVTKTWVPSALSVTPETAVNTVGEAHTVTATISGGLTRTQIGHRPVIFTITGAHTTQEVVEVDPDRTATFTYQGTAAGVDSITACQDINNNRICDPEDASDTASKEWVVAPEPTSPPEPAPAGPPPAPTPGPDGPLPDTGTPHLVLLLVTAGVLIALGSAALAAWWLSGRRRT